MSSLAAIVVSSLLSASLNPCDDLKAGKPVLSISAADYVSKMKDAVPAAKGDYETTPAYKHRSEAQVAAFVSANQYIAFRKDVIGTLSFNYNADNSELSYNESSSCAEKDAAYCLNILLDTKPSISLLSSYSVELSQADRDSVLFPVMKVSPERARSIREGEISTRGAVSLLMIVQPQEPYYVVDVRNGDGTKYRWFEDVRLPVRLLCTGWIVEDRRPSLQLSSPHSGDHRRRK